MRLSPNKPDQLDLPFLTCRGQSVTSYHVAEEGVDHWPMPLSAFSVPLEWLQHAGRTFPCGSCIASPTPGFYDPGFQPILAQGTPLFLTRRIGRKIRIGSPFLLDSNLDSDSHVPWGCQASGERRDYSEQVEPNCWSGQT